MRDSGGDLRRLEGDLGRGDRGTQRVEGARDGGTNKEGALSPEGAFGQALGAIRR